MNWLIGLGLAMYCGGKLLSAPLKLSGAALNMLPSMRTLGLLGLGFMFLKNEKMRDWAVNMFKSVFGSDYKVDGSIKPNEVFEQVQRLAKEGRLPDDAKIGVHLNEFIVNLNRAGIKPEEVKKAVDSVLGDFNKSLDDAKLGSTIEVSIDGSETTLNLTEIKVGVRQNNVDGTMDEREESLAGKSLSDALRLVEEELNRKQDDPTQRKNLQLTRDYLLAEVREKGKAFGLYNETDMLRKITENLDSQAKLKVATQQTLKNEGLSDKEINAAVEKLDNYKEFLDTHAVSSEEKVRLVAQLRHKADEVRKTKWNNLDKETQAGLSKDKLGYENIVLDTNDFDQILGSLKEEDRTVWNSLMANVESAKEYLTAQLNDGLNMNTATTKSGMTKTESGTQRTTDVNTARRV